MKTCSSCKIDKDESEYNKATRRADGLQTNCKVCSRNKSQEYYSRNKEAHCRTIHAARSARRKLNQTKLVEYLSDKKCADCPESDMLTFDFDHVSGTKSYNIAMMCSQGCSWDTILLEIEKCVIRCANCHRRKTARDQGWFKLIGQQIAGH